jgi:N-acylneuraminate cytidylyltransferase/CMP-N,N'-diacetyllegionaminic acid synthase
VSYVAFVPARSGSKRLPGKNVKLLAGKPLVAWTLEACTNSKYVESVVFSTDSEEYWEIVQRHLKSDKLTLDFRSPDEAGDTVKIFDYLKASHKKIFAGKGHNFVMALPTVPFRSARHIDEAIALFARYNKPVFSATAYGFPISFAFHVDDQGEWSPVFPDGAMVTGNTRSQDQRIAYHPNGAIYVRRVDDLAQPNLRTLYQGARPYLMERDVSLDIDNEIDFTIAETLIKSGYIGG